MTDVLHYRGDCRNYDPNHVYGPDMFGGHYRALSTSYDEGADVTTIEFTPTARPEPSDDVGGFWRKPRSTPGE